MILSLELMIAKGQGGREGLLVIVAGHQSLAICVIRPHSRQTVRFQLVRLRLGRRVRDEIAPDFLLQVVRVLMRDQKGDTEIPGSLARCPCSGRGGGC